MILRSIVSITFCCISVTTAENGLRALEYLGLLEDAKENTLKNNVKLSLYPDLFRILLLFLKNFCYAGLEGKSSDHRLLHAGNDRVRITQEDQGNNSAF